MIEVSPQDMELLRAAVRAYLVGRQRAAFDVDSIHSAMVARRLVDFKIEPEHVALACDFLESLGQITHRFAELGSTKFYSPTAAGILAHERQPR